MRRSCHQGLGGILYCRYVEGENSPPRLYGPGGSRLLQRFPLLEDAGVPGEVLGNLVEDTRDESVGEEAPMTRSREHFARLQG